MKKAFNTLLKIISLTYSILELPSCTNQVVFNEYSHTPVAGWEKNDALSFNIPPIAQAGDYEEELGLRITGDYPFMGLTLIVEQTVYPDKDKKWEKTERRDTIQCKLIDNNGTTTGQGVSSYQYVFPVNMYHLDENDSVHVTIRHDMKREILPGISDIGLKLSHSK